MRSIWRGYISFGLVHIPVKLYAATEDRSVRFNLLHEVCGQRVRYRRWCDLCDREIPPEEIVKAYRWAPDQYVVVDEDDLANLPVPTGKSIVIKDFVRLDSVDPIYFNKPYYLEPVDGGSRAYNLLRAAMQESSLIALAKVVLRNKESLACLRIYDDNVLLLQTMHYPDEIRSPQELQGIQDEAALDPGELALAVQLVKQLSSPFDPGRYQDEYRRALLARIDAKVRGEKVITARAEAPPVVDLMEALRASLATVNGNGAVPPA